VRGETVLPTTAWGYLYVPTRYPIRSGPQCHASYPSRWLQWSGPTHRLHIRPTHRPSSPPQLCSKKDIERWDIVKALKAHALERTGRVEEALELCREVKARNPTEDSVLNTLVITFKVSRDEGGIA
jgi:hypothetical protein